MNSDEHSTFLLNRLGSVGGSTVSAALAVLKRKSGDRAAGDRAQESINLMYELAAERITGEPAKHVNALQWGIDHEQEALAAYKTRTNEPIVEAPGVIRHPSIRGSHASPDALVGTDGGIEIKCPTSAVHLRTLLSGEIPKEHIPQILWNMACCRERLYWDFISYDPRFPDGLQLFVKRILRDEKAIEEMEEGVRDFLVGVDAKLQALLRKVEGK